MDRVISIFNALLRLAEIDTGMRRSGFVDVDLGQLCAHAVEFYVPAAEVKDINIGGVVHIGHITSTATSSAKGSPGTTHATYERHFSKVSMPGYSCDDNCNPQDVVDNANHVIGPKFVFELPTYAAVRTPRGALASVLREPWQHQQDVAINDQSQTESQVAALRVTQVNDNTTASREVFEFAATEADSNYAIYAVDNFDDADLSTPAADDGPTASGDLSAPAAGTDSALGQATDATLTEPAANHQDTDGGNLIQRFLRRLGHGLRLLFTGKHHTLLNLALWALLFTPVFLSARRRYLLRLIGEYTS